MMLWMITMFLCGWTGVSFWYALLFGYSPVNHKHTNEILEFIILIPFLIVAGIISGIIILLRKLWDMF